MIPIIFKDIDASCVCRRKYVSDDFPFVGYEAAFRHCVDKVLREREIEMRDILEGDYYKTYYKDDVLAKSIAETFNDVFSFGCTIFDPKDEIHALLHGRVDHFEIIDACSHIRRKFGVDADDLLFDRKITFGQLIDFISRQRDHNSEM